MPNHEIILDHPEAWEKNLDKLLLSLDEFTNLQDKPPDEYLKHGKKLSYLFQIVYNQKSKKDKQSSFSFFDKEKGRRYDFSKTEGDGNFKFVFKCLEKRNLPNFSQFPLEEKIVSFSIEAQGNIVIFLIDKKIEFSTLTKDSVIKNRSNIEVILDRAKIFR